MGRCWARRLREAQSLFALNQKKSRHSYKLGLLTKIPLITEDR